MKSGAKASVIKHETFNVDWSKEKVDPQTRLAAVVSQLPGPPKLTIKLCTTGAKLFNVIYIGHNALKTLLDHHMTPMLIFL